MTCVRPSRPVTQQAFPGDGDTTFPKQNAGVPIIWSRQQCTSKQSFSQHKNNGSMPIPLPTTISLINREKNCWRKNPRKNETTPFHKKYILLESSNCFEGNAEQ
mmetsp:Transcript_7128/g.17899  ORF Transcript_7128/g.17899 Transcript_7128/m.17899 type:complete len:104 (-) Transcript_7128:88-399(-)